MTGGGEMLEMFEIFEIFVRTGSAFDVARALEHERDAVLILRHHRWTPSTPATLVQQVGQRVLIVARVA